MGRYEVTQELYETVMKSDPNVNANPSLFADVNEYPLPDGEEVKYRPVENVSFYDAIYFCNALTKSTMSEDDCVYKITNIVRDPETKSIEHALVESDIKKNGYRLPTEAEWEFAARGGDYTSDVWKNAFAGIQISKGNLLYDKKNNKEFPLSNFLDQDDNLRKVAWYTNNSEHKTHQVGKKQKNTLGLYDMCGNVDEWCFDKSVILKPETVIDPHYKTTPEEEYSPGITRGGSCDDLAAFCSVGSRWVEMMGRFSGGGGLGFRICRTASSETPSNWDTKAPNQVTSLSADPFSTSIDLNWKNPDNSDLKKVRVFWTKSDDEKTTLGTLFLDAVPSEEISTKITGLTLDEKYKFFIQAIDKNGNYQKAKTIEVTCIQGYENIKIDKKQVLKTEFVLVTPSKISFRGSKKRSIENKYSSYYSEDKDFIIEPFIIGKYEVTWDLFEKVMPSDTYSKGVVFLAKYFDSLDKGTTSDYSPVDSITWYDAVSFCNELTKKTMSASDCVYSITNIVRDNTSRQIVKATVSQNLEKKGYRLPTEAE